MWIKSNSFELNTLLNQKYTCDNNGISPSLFWNDAPKNTKSYIIILYDPDAPNGTFIHWILYNIPAEIKSIDENEYPYPIGYNTANKKSYYPPCPPKGSKHRYIFTIYACNDIFLVENDSSINEIMNFIENHKIDMASIQVYYER